MSVSWLLLWPTFGMLLTLVALNHQGLVRWASICEPFDRLPDHAAPEVVRECLPQYKPRRERFDGPKEPL